MRRYCVTLLLAVVFPAFTAAADAVLKPAEAEQGDAAWVKVERLRLGQTIRVLGSDQRSRTGRLTCVTNEAAGPAATKPGVPEVIPGAGNEKGDRMC